MFKNCTFKKLLPAAFLLASVGAYAADEVTLYDGSKTTWAEVQDALNGTTDIATLQQAVTNAQSAANLVEPKTETTVDSIIGLQMEAATAFKKAYNTYYNNDVKDDDEALGKAASLWYKATTNKDKQTSLTLSFTKQTEWEVATVVQFFDKYTSAEAVEKTKVAALYLYLNADNTAYQVSTYEQTSQKSLVTIAADFLNNTIPTLKSFQETKNTKEYTAALEKVTTAQKALDDALKAQTNYQTITLNADVTATAAIKNFTGSIIGGGYVITAPADAPVFTKLSGDIHNVAVNGQLAGANSGTLSNVAVLGSKKYYDEAGAATDYTTLGAFGFAVRANWGLTADGNLAKVTDANRVYDITVYSNAESSFQSYVTYTGVKYSDVDNNFSEVEVGDNVFVKSATGDLNAVNVIYNGKSANVVIKDDVNFFCPEEITAASVTYDREFAVGHNVVCLPFSVDSDFDAQFEFATFETENTEENTFVFTFQTAPIAANTPMILKAKAAGALPAIKNATIAATPAKQVVEGANGSFGVLKKATIQEILGASNADKVYGFVDGKFCQAIGTPTEQTVSAFRMVVTSATANQAPRRIVIRGEEDESAAVESVSANAAGFEVAAGYGELIFNAAEDCGNVVVYSIDGKVAANANVTVGTTTVNVPKGVYVVNGKKVAVK